MQVAEMLKQDNRESAEKTPLLGHSS